MVVVDFDRVDNFPFIQPPYIDLVIIVHSEQNMGVGEETDTFDLFLAITLFLAQGLQVFREQVQAVISGYGEYLAKSVGDDAFDFIR